MKRPVAASRPRSRAEQLRHQARGADAMMPTLEENARIEEVRRLRDNLADMIKRSRYADALVAAEEIIARFPGTRAAHELSSQMPRLRARAKGE